MDSLLIVMNNPQVKWNINGVKENTSYKETIKFTMYSLNERLSKENVVVDLCLPS